MACLARSEGSSKTPALFFLDDSLKGNSAPIVFYLILAAFRLFRCLFILGRFTQIKKVYLITEYMLYPHLLKFIRFDTLLWQDWKFLIICFINFEINYMRGILILLERLKYESYFNTNTVLANLRKFMYIVGDVAKTRIWLKFQI